MPHPFTTKQTESFNRGRWLIETYPMISPDHQDPTIHRSVVVGDMIADLIYTMTRVWDYPKGDIESVVIAALSGITHDHCTTNPEEPLEHLNTEGLS